MHFIVCEARLHDFALSSLELLLEQGEVRR
jgi:hypothetical protein